MDRTGERVDTNAAPGPPAWLLALGIAALAIMGSAMFYAVAIGIANFHRIGV